MAGPGYFEGVKARNRMQASACSARGERELGFRGKLLAPLANPSNCSWIFAMPSTSVSSKTVSSLPMVRHTAAHVMHVLSTAWMKAPHVLPDSSVSYRGPRVWMLVPNVAGAIRVGSGRMRSGPSFARFVHRQYSGKANTPGQTAQCHQLPMTRVPRRH